MPAVAHLRIEPSLLDIPLVAAMLADEAVKLAPRAIDNDWTYAGRVRGPIAGFNPHRREVYYAVRSALGRWVAAPSTALRELNVKDRLVRETLFAAHDYLHVWSALQIRTLVPELGFGHLHITEENVEDYVFCQLLTETAATVGLDYWYLARVDLEEVVPIGTCINTLTTAYREQYRDEYRRYSPALEVQRPAFFEVMARFYCSGRLPGFRGDALTHSPRVLAWLEHELRYGCAQRRYTRQWLSYLAEGRVSGADDIARLERPVAYDVPWRQELISVLAHRLWEFVHGVAATATRSASCEASWAVPSTGPIDFRFTNVNALGDDLWDSITRRGLVPASFPYFFAQFVSGHVFDDVDPALVDVLPALVGAGSPTLLRHTFATIPRVPRISSEPSALFVLS